MQDTPQFETIKARFNGYSKEQIIGSPPNSISGNDVEIFNQIFNNYPLYFSDNAFRQKLTLQGKQVLESQISASCDQFDQIIQTRAAGTLPQQLPTFISNLSSYFEEFRSRFINPKRLDILEGGADTSRVIAELDANLKDAENTKKQIEEVLQVSQALALNKGATELANYFHKLYDGKEIEIEEAPKKKKVPFRLNAKDILLAVLLCFFIALILPELSNLISSMSSKDHLRLVIGISTLLTLVVAYMIYRFALIFNSKYVGGYKRASVLWANGVVIALIITAVYTYITIKSLKLNPNDINVAEALIKAVLLLAPIYFIRFCVRNFNANKHLGATNLHRATSIRIFESFIQSINSDNKEVYSQMAKIVFELDETGFITRREGAGGSESTIEIPFLKK